MTTVNRLLLPSRLPHAGEIRGGERRLSKGGKLFPARLDTWRLTGGEHIIRAAAAAYGGEPTEWPEATYPDAWQVITNTRDLHVLIPHGTAITDDPRVWEQWVANARTHACDGITCTRVRIEGKGADRIVHPAVPEPCSCNPEDPTCKPTTVLRVILPLLPGAGAWRLVTHSIHGAMELRTTVQMLIGAGAPNPTPAYLRMAQRRGTDPDGQPRTFPVPVLEPAQSVFAAAIGPGAFPDAHWQTAVHQLTAPPAHAGELGTGSPTGEIGAGSTAGPSSNVDPEPDLRMEAHQRGLQAILADGWTVEELQAAWDAEGQPWCDTDHGTNAVRRRLEATRA